MDSTLCFSFLPCKVGLLVIKPTSKNTGTDSMRKCVPMPGIQEVDKYWWYHHHYYYHSNKIKFTKEKFLWSLATISTIKLTPFHWSGNCETQVTGRETLRPHLKLILQDWNEDTESATRKSITLGQLAGNRPPCTAHAKHYKASQRMWLFKYSYHFPTQHTHTKWTYMKLNGNVQFLLERWMHVLHDSEYSTDSEEKGAWYIYTINISIEKCDQGTSHFPL